MSARHESGKSVTEDLRNYFGVKYELDIHQQEGLMTFYQFLHRYGGAGGNPHAWSRFENKKNIRKKPGRSGPPLAFAIPPTPFSVGGQARVKVA